MLRAIFTRVLGAPARFGILGFSSLLCLILAGCGSATQPIICAVPAGGGQCAATSPHLYATSTSNQVLPFQIDNSSGALTAATPIAGPANSSSIVNLGFFLMFADPATNAVDSDQINEGGGLMTVQGSPFALGTAAGGPTGILGAPAGFFYASEPNGTILGFSTPDDGTLTGAVPDSPFAAGSAPGQMAATTLNPDAPGMAALYASDAAPSGGVLAYTINSAGSLTPINGSPFAVLPDWSAGSVVVANSYLIVSYTSLAGPTNFGKVTVLAIDLDSGALTPVPGSPFSVGNAPSALAVDSANHIFVMNGGDHTISAFNLEGNGMLSAIGSPVAAGTANSGIALYPPYLYAADTAAGSILTFSIDSSTGSLTSAGSTTTASPPLQLTVVNLPTI
jgi:6-phosphogluconolactonase